MPLLTLNIIIAAVFIWIGFVGAISFMEARLKFKAPGVSRAIGLGIGQIVFKALNKVEWVLASAIFLALLWSLPHILTVHHIPFLMAFALLVIQSFLLLPVLFQRAQSHISEVVPPPSNVHVFYIVAEVIKVLALFFYGIILLFKLYP